MNRFAVLFALISTLASAQDRTLNEGVAAFKNGRYQQAVELFLQAVAQHPNEVNPHLYLGTTYLSMWVPGSNAPENNATADSAKTEFLRVLELDASNTVALASLGDMAFNSASSLQGEEKIHRLDEAMDWNKRLAAVDSNNKAPFYSMGVIAWSKWYPALMSTRTRVGLRPEDPGPIKNPERQNLKEQYGSILEEGINDLTRALSLDPDYADAMAYLNLLIRERADLRDTKEEYAADIAIADDWVRKSVAAKASHPQPTSAPPPPPPPPPVGGGGSLSPTRIRVSGNVQETNLLTHVDPVYPPLALQARISGRLRFTATIGKDGHILNLQLVSGHPLLIASAQEAVKQYTYRPTLLNGAPVEVVTMVDVNFVLP